MSKSIQDKILHAILDVQERMECVESDVGTLKHSHERTFRRIDDFLSLIGRHEAEIAALRMSQKRMDGRMSKLEK